MKGREEKNTNDQMENWQNVLMTCASALKNNDAVVDAVLGDIGYAICALNYTNIYARINRDYESYSRLLPDSFSRSEKVMIAYYISKIKIKEKMDDAPRNEVAYLRAAYENGTLERELNYLPCKMYVLDGVIFAPDPNGKDVLFPFKIENGMTTYIDTLKGIVVVTSANEIRIGQIPADIVNYIRGWYEEFRKRMYCDA